MAMQSNREYRDFRVRRKADFGTADPARWSYIDGNSFIVTIAGTASDGDYVITITPAAAGVATIPITVTRATTPATNTNIATAMAAAANALLTNVSAPAPTALSEYIESVSSSGAVVQFIVKRGAPRFTVATSETTATGTLELSPNDTFPISLSTLGYGPQVGPRMALEVTLIPVNSSGVPLDPGTATADLTVRRMVERGSRDAYDRPSTPVGVGSATTTSAHPLGAPFRVAGGGGRFTFALGAQGGGAITGQAATEVHVREVTE